MSYKLKGKSLVSGDWISSGSDKFSSDPYSGPSNEFFMSDDNIINQAVNAAEKSFSSFSISTNEERAELLNSIAEEIDIVGEEITEVGHQETGLPVARLQAERFRTVSQLRLFAEYILKDDFIDFNHDSKYQIDRLYQDRICILFKDLLDL